jgi:hypothetical protein
MPHPDRASAGLATGHEHAESRFLSRAPGFVAEEGPSRRSFEMTVLRPRRVVFSRAGRCAPCGMKRTVIPRPAHTAVCLSFDRLRGRGIYCRAAGGWTRQPAQDARSCRIRRGPVRGSRQATSMPKVDFSVARRRCRRRGSFAALLRNDSSATRASCIQSCGAVRTVWDETDCHSEARPHCRLPIAPHVAGPRNLLSGCWRMDAAAAPHVRTRNRRTGPVRGSRQATSRPKVDFSVARRGLSQKRVLRGAPSK